MYEEMDKRLDDIVGSFADEEHRLQASMTLDEFRRHLFSVSEHLSKADTTVLALRFFDGDSVSIPEFLEFFISSPAVRRAKASASAVRVGLNLFQLEQDAGHDNRQIETCGRTTLLQASVRKLAAMWKFVDAPLTLAFDTEGESGDNESAVSTTAFENVLSRICGASSASVRKAKVSPLSDTDIDLLTVRFDVGGSVYYPEFLRFFRSAVNTSSASPFVLTSEWDKLKSCMLQCYTI
jgi:hypothetical protein